MSLFMEILILMIMNFIEMMLLSLTSFFIAFKLKNNEKIENPIVSVKKAIEKNKQYKEEIKEAKKLSIMLENIENYDGSSRGQKDLEK